MPQQRIFGLLSRHSNKIWAAIAAVLFLAAGTFLYDALRGYTLAEFHSAITAVPVNQIYAALGLTALSYVVLAGYDFSALYYIQKKMPKLRVFQAAFMGFAFSQNLGVAPVTGGSVRLRVYGSAGLGGLDVAKVVTFAILTYSLGIMAIFGFLLAFFPSYLSNIDHLPILASQIIGGVTLTVLLGYVFYVEYRQKPFTFRGIEFQPPSARLSIVQLLITVLDLCLASAVLYMLLPDSSVIGFFNVFVIYVVATTIGILSHVPGGLGVFDWVVLMMLGSVFPTPAIIGALLLYRIIYLFLPLIVAAIGLMLFEWRQRRAIFSPD
jgi:uncharacterized membrane protein YbhN (UPF0104 family)